MIPGWARALLAVAAAGTLALFVAGLISPAAWEYSEGDAATWIWMLRHGREIYAAPAGLPMWSSNYPPLYLHLVARLAPSDASILQTGRLISILGYGLAAAMVGLSARAATKSMGAGVVAALLFAVTARASYQAPACRGDALALGLCLAAVHVCTVRMRGWSLFAALAFPAALLCKHSLIVAPVALGIWSIARAPKHAVLLLASAVGFFVVVARLGWFAPLFEWSQSSWSLRLWLSSMGWWVLPSALGLILGGMACKRAPGPWQALFVVGAIWTLALGRVGASFNYTLELLAAISVLSVVIAHEHKKLFLAHLVVTSLEAIGWSAWILVVILPAERRELLTAQSILREVEDPIFVEQTWHATSLGRPPIAIPFLSSHLAESGRWDQRPLLELIEKRAFGRVLLDFSLENPGWHADRFTKEELAALRVHYVQSDQVGQLRVHKPRAE